ncbi:MAG: YfiR family protein [Calditrichales bacterium]|nr:YfiR family protein [Calditrichales bacterium]
MSSEKLFSYQKFAWLFLLLSFLVPQLVCAQYTEYDVKAVYLEKFTRFIDWPGESTVSDTSKPFILGVVGRNPFGPILENIYSSQKIKNKEVKIIHISNPNKISGCHLLFVSKSEKNKLTKILSQTKNKPILTIGDTKGFADRGVLINFYLSYDKTRFKINETAVRESGLYMSHLLFNLAKIVNPAGGKK